jgi:hypothetical protein
MHCLRPLDSELLDARLLCYNTVKRVEHAFSTRQKLSSLKRQIKGVSKECRRRKLLILHPYLVLTQNPGNL